MFGFIYMTCVAQSVPLRYMLTSYNRLVKVTSLVDQRKINLWGEEGISEREYREREKEYQDSIKRERREKMGVITGYVATYRTHSTQCYSEYLHDFHTMRQRTQTPVRSSSI